MSQSLPTWQASAKMKLNTVRDPWQDLSYVSSGVMLCRMLEAKPGGPKEGAAEQPARAIIPIGQEYLGKSGDSIV